jgi:tRNA threonylcarbamoyladenosine biosynthesis protein TsaB
MNEVYFATYLADTQGLPVARNPEAIVSVERRDLLDGTGWTAAGGGWQHYPQLVAGCATAIANTSSIWYPRARYLLQIGGVAYRQGQSIDAARLQPAYLRTRVAEPMSNAGR